MRRVFFAFLMVFSCTALFAVRGQTSLVAGFGLYDGDGNTIPSATINGPKDIAISSNAVYIADTSNNVIRKVDTSGGIISTLAGTGAAGFNNGAADTALFSAPSGVCVDSTGNTVYVADSANNRIRGINISDNTVYTLTGTGANGTLDGGPLTATFSSPRAIVISKDDAYLYCADYTSSRIRRVTIATGAVTTIAGSSAGYIEGIGAASRFFFPSGLDINSAGTILYVADYSNNCVRQVDLSTNATSLIAGNNTFASYQEGTTTNAYFNHPSDVSLDEPNNRLYVDDAINYKIRSINLATKTTQYEAGSVTGDMEGASATARFAQASGMCLAAGGKLYISDTVNNKIKIMDTAASNYVTRFLGMYVYDGDGNTAPSAMFNLPVDVSINTVTARLYIADTYNNVIRMIDETGKISTIAGSGVAGYAEGAGAAAQFNQPASVVADQFNNVVYVSDTQNNRIRAIDLATNQTSLVAGSGSAAFADGIGALASFKGPQQIDIDAANQILYVADAGNNRIRAINLNTKEATVLAGNGAAGYLEGTGTGAFFTSPQGLKFDNSVSTWGPMLFVADTSNRVIRWITVNTQATSLVAGSPGVQADVNGALGTARFGQPYRLAYDPAVRLLYVSDPNYNKVKQIQIWTGGQVANFVGGTPTPGYAEGIGTSARFWGPGGLSMDTINQRIYIADFGNNRIRKVDAFQATWTQTLTMTLTPTKTIAGTPTFTLTETPVYSPTITPTFTDTPTITETYSSTFTGTATPTYTVTMTWTLTGTVTDTPTVTSTASDSATATVTLTQTMSPTQTPTYTVSQTPTASFTATDSMTPTVTLTQTMSGTQTQTLTVTETPTVTMTVTDSPFVTATPTYTQTETFTFTETSTITSTQAWTFTQTSTPQDSATPTITLTVYYTETPSATLTLFVTPSMTSTDTPLLSPTLTPFVSAIPTPTVTETPIDYFGRTIWINDFFIYPNPSFGKLKIVYDITGTAVTLTIKVYTSGFRLIRSYTYENVPSGRHDPLFEDFKALNNGIYHVLLTCKGTGGEVIKETAEMLILR